MSSQDAGARTYSESWHRVAPLRAALRPSVRAHRQEFRGQIWYVLQDPLNNQFFRVTEDAYRFLSRLSPNTTVDEVWQQTQAQDPDLVLSQEEVVQLLGQLNMSNLLHFDRTTANASLFDRYRKRRQREIKARLMGFLAIHVPLLDPDRALDRLLPLIRLIFSPLGLVLYLLLLVLGLKVVIEHWDRLFDPASGLLAPDNLMLLYVGFVIAKVVHEFGHAFACKRFGGEVHVMGVMLLLLAPLPYVDASASWGFRQRRKRLLVGSAGMLSEFAVAAIAAVVWAYSAPGVVNAIAYNVMFVASVSTIAFNLNPLMRFDGYHMLVDALDVPNLFQRSRDQLKYLSERFLFGVQAARTVARTREEAFWLPAYGLVSLTYWVFLMSGIVFFIADQYLDLGLLLAIILTVMFTLVPLFKFLNYLAFSPRLMMRRGRANLVTLALLGVVLGGLGGVAVPDRIRAPGVIEAVQFRELYSESAGFVAELLVAPGSRVTAGQALVRLTNDDIDLEIEQAEMERQQLLAQELRAEGQMVADLAPLRQHRAALEASLAEMRLRRQALLVTAPVAGIWSASELENSIGRWVARGTSLGVVVDDTRYRFVAVLPQVSTHVFDDQIALAEIRLNGEEHQNLRAADVTVIPYENGTLPSPALGFAGGGDIAVLSSDPHGVTAAEPFFRIHAGLAAADAGRVRLLHGRLGTMRITLGDRPLLAQWERAFRQFLQRRFRT